MSKLIKIFLNRRMDRQKVKYRATALLKNVANMKIKQCLQLPRVLAEVQEFKATDGCYNSFCC